MNLEIDGHADPAVLGDITLLGRDKTPTFHGIQRRVVELLPATAFGYLDLARFTAGKHMYAQQHRALPTATLGQRRVFRRRVFQVRGIR